MLIPKPRRFWTERLQDCALQPKSSFLKLTVSCSATERGPLHLSWFQHTRTHARHATETSVCRKVVMCAVVPTVHVLAPDLHADTMSHLRRELAETTHNGSESLSTQRHDGTGQGHHLISDAMVSDFLWSLAVVRLVGLLHDPISGAAQGLVSWSQLIGCNPWTAMRCLRSRQCHHV